MLWVLYQVLFAIGFTLMLPYFLLRMRRRGGYGPGFGERFGRYAPDVAARLAAGPRIWVHAVSVGEVHVAMAFIREWRSRRPEARFVVSVNTPTGRKVAAAQLPAQDVLVYFPVDFPPIVRRVLDAIRPAALVLCEGELWPTLIRGCARRGIPVASINARVSDRSFRGYRRVRLFTRPLLPLIARFCAQGAEDGRRLVELGAPADRVRVVGSAKYEAAVPDPATAERARAFLRDAGFPADPVILVGGSTWAGEEAALLDVHRDLRAVFPALRLVLVPRHAERAPEVVAELARRGVPFVRRSGGPAPAVPPEVALIDTTGELMAFYGAADIVFVGKSLTQHGGQNPIEPALWARPILTGPNMENFRPVVADFLETGALRQVPDAAALAAALRELLADPDRRADLGARAGAVVRAKAGAMKRTVDELIRVLPAATPRAPHPAPGVPGRPG
ncbi:MAG: 3-deoxy-D-manno-octulosonic acid transferase [Lentisphaerae bacterium]|nr:3-deoxy-D-manno-octulosonic acid transferase [Lentisphaerota bacterium]